MRSVRALVLVWRGLRFRAAGSVATLVVAVLAVAAATLGTLYSGTAQDSLVRQGIVDAGTYTTGLVADLGLTEQVQPPAQVIAAVQASVGSARYDRFWGQPSLTLTLTDRSLTLPHQLPLTANVSWRQGMCTSVDVVAGRCPTDGAGPEAMVSSRTARERGIRLGQRLPTDIGGSRARDTPVVVGFYDVGSARAPGWPFGTPDQAAPAGPTGNEHLDEVLVDQTTVQQSRNGTRVTGFRPLRPGAVHRGDLPELTRLSGDAGAPAPQSGQSQTGQSQSGQDAVQVTVASGLGQVLTAIGTDRALVRSSSTAVTVQLAVLALFVLYLVVAATSEERSGEVALAKLRGMTAGATAVFALTESLLLLLVAVPVGAVLALAVDLALSRGLAAGSEVRVDGPTVVAAGAALLGGIAASALAARRLLTTPVTGQLRRTGGRRAALARSVAMDTALLVLAAAGVYELRRGSADTLGLSSPGLLAAAAALPVIRLVPVVARVGVRRTRRSRRVAGFLAVRNLARRPAGARSVVLLAAAVALAVFGVDGFTVARGVRADTARAAVGGDRVVHVDASSAGALLAAVRAADPGGREAMAVAVANGSVALSMVAVDAPRLTATTSWDPRWGGTSPAALVAGLRPRAVPPVTAQGFLAARVEVTGKGPAADLQLSIDVLDSVGHQWTVRLGRAAPAARTALRAQLPTSCARTPCRVLDIAADRPVAAEHPVDPLAATGPVSPGVAGLVDLAGLTDARGPLAVLTPDHRPRWRYRPSALDVLDPSRIPDVAVVDGPAGSVTIALEPTSANPFTVETTDVPLQLPALVGRDTTAEPFVGRPGAVYAADLAGQSLVVAPLPGRGTLPRIGATGTLVDLESLLLSDPRSSSLVDLQVWFAPGADTGQLLARLAPAGVVPVQAAAAGPGSGPGATESVAGHIAQLSRTGPAVGLRLYVLAAVAALLLAVGALLTASLVTARRRGYEVAAVLALGAGRRALVRAGRSEQLLLIALGTAVGAAAGLAAAVLALPVLGAVTAGGPVRPPLIAWPSVLAVLAVVLGVAGVLVHLAARHVVAIAGPDRLREVQG